jgi:hypothetical protein
MKRRHLWLGVAAVAALSAWLWLRDANPSTKDIQKMSSYTEKMTTHCVGRFLIDVPQKATLSEGSYGLRIASLKTKTISPLPQAELLRKLDAALTQRAAMLAHQPRELGDETKFFARYQPSGNTHSIRYAKGDGDEVMDGYVVTDGRVFELQTSAIGEGRIKELNDFLLEVAPTLRARENSEIPTTPGFCFNGGLVTMNPKRGENASWGWTLDGHPDVYFGISIRSNGDKVEPGRLDREVEVIKELGELISDVRTLRKRRLLVGGMKAQEWSVVLTGDALEYNLEIEIPSAPNDNAAPSITMSLRAGGHNKDGKVAPSLTEGEALALWDAVVPTLRLRPGAF